MAEEKEVCENDIRESAIAKLKKYEEDHRDAFDSIENTFKKADIHKNGIITAHAFNKVLRNLKIGFTPREAL